MSSESSPRSRKRAVSLRPEAVQRLRAALAEKWQAEHPGTRLTRDLKGELLRLSPPTAERLLRGEKVDRGTIEVAFGSLGLELSLADYADEPQPQSSQPAPVTDVPSQPSPPEVSPARRSSRRTFLYYVAAGAAACALSVSLRPSSQGSTPNRDWKRLLNEANIRGTEEYYAAHYEIARSWADRALILAREYDAAGGLAESLRLSGDIYAAEGDLKRAWIDYDESLRIRKRMGQVSTYSPLYLALADVERRRGRYPEAKEDLHRALALNEAPGRTAYAWRELGQLHQDQGDWALAQKAYRRSLELLKREPDPDAVIDIRGRNALVLLAGFGSVDSARNELEACLAHWKQKGHPRWTARLELHLGRLEMREGNVARGRQYLEASRKGFKAVGDRAGVNEASQSLGTKPERSSSPGSQRASATVLRPLSPS